MNDPLFFVQSFIVALSFTSYCRATAGLTSDKNKHPKTSEREFTRGSGFQNSEKKIIVQAILFSSWATAL
jgi:hypothetical protein